MIGPLTGLSRRAATHRARELLAQFDLAEASGRTVSTYSGSMRRRLDLAAVSVSHDMPGSIINRFRILKVGGPALLAGHVAASVARNIISTLLVLGVAFLIGFRPHAAAMDWLAVAGLLLLFVLALSWFSAAIGLLAKSPEGANGFTFVIMFLPYASSAVVPIDTMPSWIQGFARHQPITPLIETLRGLMLGTPVGSNGWIAVAWCIGVLFISIALSTILSQRRTIA